MGMSASQARLLSITSRMNDIELRSQQIANTKLRLADESEQVAQNYTNALNASKFTYTDYTSGTATTVSMTAKSMNMPGSNYRLVSADGKRVITKSQAESYKAAMDSYSVQYSSSWSNNSDSDHFSNSQAVYGLMEKFGETSFNDTYKKLGLPTPHSGWKELVNGGFVTQEEIDNYNSQYEQMFNASSGSTYNSGNTKQADGYLVIDDASYSDPDWLYKAVESGQFRIEQSTSDGWKETSTSSNTQIAITSDNTNLAKAEAEYNAATAKINSKEKQLDQQLKEMDTEHSALSTEQDSIKSLVKDNIDKTFNLFS